MPGRLGIDAASPPSRPSGFEETRIWCWSRPDRRPRPSGPSEARSASRRSERNRLLSPRKSVKSVVWRRSKVTGRKSKVWILAGCVAEGWQVRWAGFRIRFAIRRGRTIQVSGIVILSAAKAPVGLSQNDYPRRTGSFAALRMTKGRRSRPK